MGRNTYQPEQIIAKLKEAVVLLSKVQTVFAIVRQLGITEKTNYRWRKAYGGMQVNHALRFKALEKENSQLKKLVADLSLDNGHASKRGLEGEPQEGGENLETGRMEDRDNRIRPTALWGINRLPLRPCCLGSESFSGETNLRGGTIERGRSIKITIYSCEIGSCIAQ
jgi:putative transposase